MLTALLIRGVTLDGALEGIEFYLKPDFSKLTHAQVAIFSYHSYTLICLNNLNMEMNVIFSAL